MTLRMEDFPEDLQSRFDVVLNELTQPKSGSETPKAKREGTVNAACDELTDDEASKLASEI